jgi:uncharacterized protein YjbI with pentapeptide repeats
MIEIKSISGTTLYVAKDAKTARAALEAAVADGAYLTRANLVGANLAGANLVGANLAGANLVGANLAGANLDGANLAGANLVGANLAGANLDGAIWVGVANILRTAIVSMNDSGRHWIQGTERELLEDGSTAYCSIGSVNAQATAPATARTIAIWLLNSVAAGSIVDFNDASSTTWEDVQAVFAVAIKHADRFAARAEA